MTSIKEVLERLRRQASEIGNTVMPHGVTEEIRIGSGCNTCNTITRHGVTAETSIGSGRSTRNTCNTKMIEEEGMKSENDNGVLSEKQQIKANIPPLAQTADGHAENIMERAAIVEHDGGLPKDQAEDKAVAETGACPCCGETRFWVGVHGSIGCGSCHPPATSGLVARWIEGRAG